MHLLHQRILEECPEAAVTILTNWPREKLEPMDEESRMVEKVPGYPSFDDNDRYFLFDEGQSTYWDTTLWVAFKDRFQVIRDPKPPLKSVYAILFCSYGNETVSTRERTTPLDLSGAVVTLERTNLGVSEPCGLLLDKEEFSQLIQRKQGKLLLADDLSAFVYDFTRGHVGAIVAVIQFLLKKVPTYESRVT
jgi:hypothetical protein